MMTQLKRISAAAIFVGLALAPGRAPGAPLPAEDPRDRGVFVLSVAGRQMGTEAFEIVTRKDAVEASARIELRVAHEGKSVSFKTSPRLVLTPDLRPVAYEWSQKGAQSSGLKVDLSSAPVIAKYHTVSGAEDVREFELPPDLIVLDNNVIHHYQLAVYRYRRSGGGTQSFQAFIPQEALPGSLQIENAGPERLEVGGREAFLEHLVVTTDNARIDLWTDDRGRVQKLSIPAAQLEVLRKK